MCPGHPHENLASKKSNVRNALFKALFILIAHAPFVGEATENSPYDEITVFFSLPRVGGTYIPALIQGDNRLYLSVSSVFDFLKIKNESSLASDSITGFFIDPNKPFVIDNRNKHILYNNKSFDITEEELIRTETNLYLSSDYFNKVFGLSCTFNSRTLSVLLQTGLDLPIIREMRREMMHRNIARVQGVIKADTTIKKRHPFFNLGIADWSLIHSSQSSANSNTRINIKLGTVVAGGEATVSLDYDDSLKLNRQKQFYQWRYVNNDNKILRQFVVGNVVPKAYLSLFVPVIGLQVSNVSTLRKRSFGSCILSDKTEPDWMVELYVNDVLVDYQKADAFGSYSFDVPMVFGNTSVKLKFYGPNGEQVLREKQITIPFNFMAPHKFEYTLTAGKPQDSLNRRYAKAVFNYGIAQRLTIGGGMEYLSSVSSGRSMPFVNSSARLFNNILFSTEYIYNVRSKATVMYRLPSHVQAELNFVRYKKGQQAIINSNLEEKRVLLTFPFRSKKTLWFSKFSLTQMKAPALTYDSLIKLGNNDIKKIKTTTAELMLSCNISRFNAGINGFATVNQCNYYSNISFGYRFPSQLSIRGITQLNFTEMKMITLKWEMEKQISNRGFLNFSLEKNYLSKTALAQLGIRYNFSFAKTGISSIRSNKKTSWVLSAGGSLLFHPQTGSLLTSNQNSVGRGGIILQPFLDLNCNGKRDKNEQNVSGLNYHINGGRAIKNENEPVRIVDLEAYTNYLVRLDDKALGNIAWQVKNKTLSVAISPNSFHVVEIPVSVVGEVSGTIYLDKGKAIGLSQIAVEIYDSTSTKVTKVFSEPNGYFNFLGLVPGKYTARLDSVQLEKFGLKCPSPFVSFAIEENPDGGVADGLEFHLQSLLSENKKEQNNPKKRGRRGWKQVQNN